MIDLIILALAVHQTVNVIRFSSLFASHRNWVELGCPGCRPKWLVWWLTEVIGCAWCMSINIAIVYTLLFLFDGSEMHRVLPDWLGWLCSLLVDLRELARAVIIALAVAQVANLIHALTGHAGYKLNS